MGWGGGWVVVLGACEGHEGGREKRLYKCRIAVWVLRMMQVVVVAKQLRLRPSR